MSEHDESGDPREPGTSPSEPDEHDDPEGAPEAATRTQRRWPWVVALIVALGIVGAIAAAVLTLPSVRTIQGSAADAQQHLVQVKNALATNDAATARANVAAARDDIAKARSAADVLPLRLASYIPVVSSPVNDVNHLISAADSTVAASDALVSAYAATLDPTGGSGLFQDGAVDLAALSSLTTAVSTAVDDLNTASGELDQVSASLPGSGQLAQARDSARAEIEPLRTTLGALDAALPSVPDALGQSSPRRYLLAVLNPAELRASGGAPLSVALLTFDNGKLSVSDQGQTSTELSPGNPYLTWEHVTGPPFAKGSSRSRFANANAHADFRLSGEELMRAWEAAGKPEVDGVIAIDTTAIVEALRATGPVSTEGFGTVTADDFVDKWIDSYRLFESDPMQRQSINDELATALIDRVTGGDSVFDIVRSMASTAPGRHLQVTMRTPELQRVVEEAGFAGMVSTTTGDHAAWYSLNINASKTDVFSDRVLTINAVLNSDGGATVTQTMTATNNVPAWFGNGQNVGYLTSWNASRWLVYVPNAAVDEKLAIPVGWRKVSPWNDGLDKRFLLSSGWLDRGESATLTLTYTLPPGTFADGVYRLTIDPQATLRPTMASVTVTHPNASPVTALQPTPVNRIITVTSAP